MNNQLAINKIYWAEVNESIINNSTNLIYSSSYIDFMKNIKDNNNLESVNDNQHIKIQDIDFEILSKGLTNTEFLNNTCMILKINNYSILFLADAQEEQGNYLISTQKEKLQSQFVQMAHHGQNGVSESVYKIINPKVCLWSTPEWLWSNNNGLGNYQTLIVRNWMSKLNVSENIVAKDGDTMITIYEDESYSINE